MEVAKNIEPPTMAAAAPRTVDFALVVGINDYPGHRSLRGAVEDAARFCDWLCRAEGGGLDPPTDTPCGVGRRVWKVTSTAVPPTPEQKHVDRALLELLREADRIGGGRRLYFYFSGHGANATDLVGNVALLLADWSRDQARLGLSSTGYTNYLVEHGLFEEVVVFLDCCRTETIPIIPLSCTLTPQRNTPAIATRTFVAYAAEAGQSAFERPDHDLWQGVFTRCLLGVLEQAPHGLTADELKDHLEAAVTARRLGQQAHVVSALLASARFGTKGTLQQLEVTFTDPTPGIVRLLDGSLTPVSEHDRATGSWRIALAPGLYKLVGTGSERPRLVDFPTETKVEL